MTETNKSEAEEGKAALAERLRIIDILKSDAPHVWEMNALPLSLGLIFIALGVIMAASS